jgi:cysteine desulfurase / selenocysteine lyase
MNTKQQTYLNTASSGLLSPHALAAADEFNRTAVTQASVSFEHWRFKEFPEIRKVLAAFLGADVNNVAFVPNFSYALTAVVHSLKGTERVLLYKHDYPSVFDPFKVNNFDITSIESGDGFGISIDEMKGLCLSKNIEVIAISHVHWMSGFKLDIYELANFCREHNIVLIVDATQSLGAVQLNCKELGADVVISSNYKWMNAGFGSGVMYMSDTFFKRYPPKIAGMGSYTFRLDGPPVYEPSIRNYEPGHPAIHNLIMLEAAMKQKLDMGLEKIETHNRGLTQQLLDGMKDTPVKLIGDYGTANRSSIVVIKDENGLGAFLDKEGVIVTHKGGQLRISMHFYNTEADVARCIACLKAFYRA